MIDGTERENDELVSEWPHGVRGAPVWHMNESIDRLVWLADEWPRVCIGSSGEFETIGTQRWHHRMQAAMNALCGEGAPPVWIHMLRGLALGGSEYPFASMDSTDIARNHARGNNNAASMAARWDSMQCPPRWSVREQLTLAGGQR